MFESDNIEIALAEQEISDFGATLIFEGKSYPCSSGPEMLGDILGEGGFGQKRERHVVVRKSQLPAGKVFRASQFFQVIFSDGIVHKLKIKEGGISDLVYAWDLTGEAEAEGI
jgi:hypothetical protein